MGNFSAQHKSATAYLDLAANAHGKEKGSLVLRALARTSTEQPVMVEIGPGGGAAVAFLAEQLGEQQTQPVNLTLIEAPDVTSKSLDHAIDRFGHIGTCTLLRGAAQDLVNLVTTPIDVISASSLLHEMYSYKAATAGCRA